VDAIILVTHERPDAWARRSICQSERRFNTAARSMADQAKTA